jgi:hypothetical protein
VKTTFQHSLNVQRAGIPRDARLTVDLFLDGRPLLHPEAYPGPVPGEQRAARSTLFGNAITLLEGCHRPEVAHVWLTREARFAFNRDLRRCSFKLKPPPNVDAGHPSDIEVRCEGAGVVIAHRFTDRSPFTVTVDAPKAGQTVLVTAGRELCPDREGVSTDTRCLALDLYGMETLAP